jgi:hypothetical protein
LATDPASCDAPATAGTQEGFTFTATTGTTQTATATVMKNGVATAITCQIGASGTNCTDTANSATFAVGDRISVRVVRAGASTAVWNSNYRFQLGGTTLVTGTPEYGSVTAACALAPNTNPGTCDTTVAAGQTVRGFTFTVNAAPGTGNTVIAKLFKNGVATTITCTLTAALTTCSDAVNEVVLAANDVIAVQLTKTGTNPWNGSITTMSLASNSPTSISNPHMVMDQVVLNGTGSTTVNLPGVTAFSSNTSYVCTVTAVAAVPSNVRYGVQYTSGSAFAITNSGSSAETMGYICIGN